MDLAWRRSNGIPLDFNGPTDRPYPRLPADFAERPLYQLLQEAAAVDPDAPAIVDGRERLSYRELLRRVRLAARAVAAAGSGPIAVVMSNTPAGVAAILGCLVARRIVLLLDDQQPAERNAAILRDAGAAAMLCGNHALPGDLPRLALGRLFDGPDDPGWLAPAAFGPDDPAMVFFTSGSTGRPKGIVVSLWSLLFRGRLMVDALHMGPADRMLNCSQSSASSSFARYLATLCIGSRLVLYQPAADGIAALADRLRDEAVTVLIANPPLLRTLLALPQMHPAFGTLRALRSAGAALLWADVEAARAILPVTCQIDTTYASTEAGIVAAWVVPRQSGNGPRVPSGYLMEGSDVALLDASDGVGELVVRSRAVALGEWQDGRCVPGRMPPDAAHPGWRVFRTGDLVRIDGDDMLHFASRADQQIKINGVRIEPAEIEAVLRRVAGVTDVVVATSGEAHQVSLTAYIAAEGDLEIVRDASLDRLRAELPPAMRPARIEILDRLPRMAGGKIDMRALTASAGQRRET